MGKIRLYSKLATKDTILELWGGSTKHPDSKFFFSDYLKVEYINEDVQIFQWLLECASKMSFPFHAYKIMKFAENYYETNKTKEELRIELKL